jgi:hypothetical protein
LFQHEDRRNAGSACNLHRSSGNAVAKVEIRVNLFCLDLLLSHKQLTWTVGMLGCFKGPGMWQTT